MDKSFIKLVISVGKEWTWVLEDMNLEMSEIIVVTDCESKWRAMSGCDMGMVITGEMVNECAALHLPIVCLNY